MLKSAGRKELELLSKAKVYSSFLLFSGKGIPFITHKRISGDFYRNIYIYCVRNEENGEFGKQATGLYPNGGDLYV
jgi:hypothetical protein